MKLLNWFTKPFKRTETKEAPKESYGITPLDLLFDQARLMHKVKSVTITCTSIDADGFRGNTTLIMRSISDIPIDFKEIIQVFDTKPQYISIHVNGTNKNGKSVSVPGGTFIFEEDVVPVLSALKDSPEVVINKIKELFSK